MCQMGTGEHAVVDQSLGVDQSLRVHGLDGLRVVDTSVMPAAVCGTTALPLALLAEHAAALLFAASVPSGATLQRIPAA
jgi:choline dehydrogenase